MAEKIVTHEKLIEAFEEVIGRTNNAINRRGLRTALEKAMNSYIIIGSL